MVIRACIVVAVATGAILILLRPAGAVDGRYVGTFVETRSDGQTDRNQRHLLDVGTRRTITGGLDLRLRTSLNYSARPGESHTDLLRSRWLGELRAPHWRLHGQLVPWQDAAAGESSPRTRSLQLGLDLTPRRLPQLLLNYAKQSRITAEGLSSSEDSRIETNYALRNLGMQLAYRHLNTQPSAVLETSTTTDEWRGGVNGGGNWRGVSGRANYDLVLVKFRGRERRLDQRLHRLSMNSSWSLGDRLLLGATGLVRWGVIDDNVDPERRDLDERSAGVRGQYRPFESLTIEASREYRQRQTAGATPITDYTRGRITFIRRLTREVELQTGYQTTINLRSEGGDVPANDGYALVDGRLLRGVDGRAEVRALRATGGVQTSTQWRRLLQLRTTPNRSSRVELAWRSDIIPSVGGAAQHDRQWNLIVAYFPLTGASLTISAQRLTGHGRNERTERSANLTGSWQVAPDTRISADWSRRRTTGLSVASSETVVGVNFKSRVSRNVEGQLSWRRIAGTGRDRSRTFAATVSRNL